MGRYINKNKKAIPSSFPDSHLYFLAVEERDENISLFPCARKFDAQFAGGRHTNSLSLCKMSQVGNLNC